MARIFLNRPQKVNALDSPLLDALASTVGSLSADPALRVVVLAGRGKAFCAGADVNELAALDAHSAREFITRIHRACDAVRRLPVPVVAQLHGAVIGGGLELAASCDLRIGAYEWGLVETLCPAAELDQTVAATVQLLLAGERDALRMQKELLQMWEEQPLSQSIAVSVERFSQAYAARNTISRVKTPGKH